MIKCLSHVDDRIRTGRPPAGSRGSRLHRGPAPRILQCQMVRVNHRYFVARKQNKPEDGFKHGYLFIYADRYI